jgi:hypothetical protein
MKKARLIKLAIALIGSSSMGTAVSAYTPPATNRVAIDFNDNWKYFQGDASGAQATAFADGSWESVVLPHSTKFITPDDFSNYSGISWYASISRSITHSTGEKSTSNSARPCRPPTFI